MRSRGCSTAIADKLCTRTCPLGARSQCKFTDKPQAFVNWNYKVWPSEGSAGLCAGRMQVGVVSALWTTMFPLVASQTRGKATGRGPRPVLRLRPSGSGHAEGMGFVPMLLVLPLASVTARTTFRDDLAMTYHPRAGQPVRLLETETERDGLHVQDRSSSQGFTASTNNPRSAIAKHRCCSCSAQKRRRRWLSTRSSAQLACPASVFRSSVRPFVHLPNLTQRTNGRTNERTDGRTNERTTNGWTDEQTNERRTNDERTSERRKSE